jgi:hypothetical protein
MTRRGAAETPCIKTLRNPRLNNCVVSVAVLTRLSTLCISLVAHPNSSSHLCDRYL